MASKKILKAARHDKNLKARIALQEGLSEKSKRKYLQARGYILPSEEGDAKDNSLLVIGHALCPSCGKREQVINDNGSSGLPFLDYFVDHYDDLKAQLCVGSKVRLFLSTRRL